MPPYIAGHISSEMPNSELKGLREVDYEYRYPRGLDLKPGSELHEELREKIWRRIWESRRVMSSKYDDWRKMDDTLKAYAPVEPHAVRGRDGADDDDPLERVIMPVTFANLETLLTYMTTAFLQDPIFTYEGVGPEDAYGAFLMTHHIARQSHRARIGLNLHTQWRDAFAYGFGVVSPVWYRKMGKKPVVQEDGFLDRMRNLFIVTDRKKKFERGVLWEGNKLMNIDPYRYFPDPNVPIHEHQEGEFEGWISEDGYMNLLGRERDSDDFLFNVQYLRHVDHRSRFSHDFHGREDRHAVESQTVTSSSSVDVIYLYVNLIPQEWGLGRGKYPEKWMFMLAADQVIIAAQPLGLNHDMFPTAVAAPNYDGYSTTPASLMDITIDLQNVIDFLYSSHIANIRKAINDMLIVDPSMINVHDLNNPKPGKIIRTRRSAWGRGGVDQHVKQLIVQDVTQANVGDAGFLMNFMQQVHGTSEGLKGEIAHRSDRVSAQEARDSRMSGLARLERLARIISMQSNLDIAYMMASHTQQFAEQEIYIKVMGEWRERLRNEFGVETNHDRIYVDPLDLMVEVDLVESDGTIPGSENAQTWTQVMQLAAQSPEIMQTLNLPKLFVHIARHLGAKNPEDFIIRAQQAAPQVMPDEEVEREVQAGNLTPISGDGSPSV